MMENFCSLCQANGIKRRLVLFQLNLEEAILLCENKDCVYPLGVTKNANLIVSRKATEVATISNLKRKRKKRPKLSESEEPENIPPCSKVAEKILQWRNADCLCWLNSLLSLLVNNVTLGSLVLKPDSLVRTLTESFNQAQELSSTNREQAENVLKDVRGTIWKHLQPKMKCQLGVNDSPVAALPLLLQENNLVAERFLQEYHWEFSCSACGYQQIDKRKKHLVTFPNVAKDFILQNLGFTRPCYKCNALGQTSKLVYDRMPDCIFLHFEQGLKEGTFEDLDFDGECGHYSFSQFIQYKRNPDHFVCWTKDHEGKRWMELDDLKSPICSWSSSLPNVPLSEVHIAVWEKVSVVINPLLPLPKMKEIRTEIKTNHTAQPTQYTRMSKISSMPLFSIHCSETITSSQDINKALCSPPPNSPALSPSRSRTALNLSLKTRSEQFEPYIPRKKRLVTQSCPSSPPCVNNPTMDFNRITLQPFLTWQEVKEQNKKLSVDELQSDSGYSSPASVSSCGSLVSGQSNTAVSVDEPLEEVQEDDHVKRKVVGQTNCLDDTNLVSKGLDSSSHIRSSGLVCKVDSLNLADKLEQLLPDCLLGNLRDSEKNPRELAKDRTVDGNETDLENIGNLSAQQDQFILDLLLS